MGRKMNKSKLTIRTDGIHAKVTIDGKEVKKVTGYSISHKASGAPIIQLSIASTDMLFESDAILELPEPYSEFYIAKQSLIDSGLVTQKQLTNLERLRS